MATTRKDPRGRQRRTRMTHPLAIATGSASPPSRSPTRRTCPHPTSRRSKAIWSPRRERRGSPGQRARHTRAVCQVPGFGTAYMLVSVQRVPRRGGDWMTYAAAPADPWHVSGQLLVPLLAGSALIVALTALGARGIVITSLKPVEAIRAKLSKNTTTDLGHRVPVPRPRDEIRDLARTVNHTLEMLDAALARERRFTADASHDLCSPVTALRTQIEEALLHPDDTDWPAVARTLLSSVDRLHVIVADQTELDCLYAGAGAPMAPVDLNELIIMNSGAAPKARPPSPTATLPSSEATGVQLLRMLTNLLDNAERHAVSTIRVTLHCRNDQAVLEVQDDGPGVPADQREVVFQRFARLDDARAKDAGVSGLGLPIAREIAHHHGGTLTIDDSDQGARFVARIPLLDPLCHHNDWNTAASEAKPATSLTPDKAHPHPPRSRLHMTRSRLAPGCPHIGPPEPDDDHAAFPHAVPEIRSGPCIPLVPFVTDLRKRRRRERHMRGDAVPAPPILADVSRYGPRPESERERVSTPGEAPPQLPRSRGHMTSAPNRAGMLHIPRPVPA